MTLFRGSKDATVLTGNTVATTADIAAALEDTIEAKNDAEAAQAATLVNLEKLNETYLGAKSSDPSLDNNGDPLTDGAIYYNTDNQITRVYDESADSWLNLNFTSDELNNINILGPIAEDIETVVGIESDVTTVSGISSQVTAVADNEQDVDTVSSSISSVEVIASDLAGAGFDYDLGSITQSTEGVVGVPDGYIITVFNIRDDITTVSGIESDVTTVSSINSDVTTTANNISDVQTVASDLNSATSDIDTVSTNITSINTVSTNIGDVTTVAGIDTEIQTVSDIDSDVSNVSSISSDVTKISGISTDVSTVSGISSDVTTVAANVSDVTNFADVYIGPASSDPSARSDGSALQNGDLYFNTTDDRLKVYDGSQWEVTARDDSEIRNLLSAAGDLTYDSATGEFSVTTYKSSDFDTDFSAKSTSDLTEGDNLYYTDARVNDDIDSRVDKTFVDALNVDSDTLDGQEGTYYLDRDNHTGTQTLSTISDSGALSALDEVDTAQIANQAVTDDKLATTLDLGSIA